MDWVTQALNQAQGTGPVPTGAGLTTLSPHVVDPTTSTLTSKGGRISSLTTGCGFTCPSTTSISIFWDGTNSSSPLRIYRDDQTIAGPFVGNIAITGLTANTKYFFYPYFDEGQQQVLFVSQPGAVGSPPIAYTSALIQNAIAQIYQGRIPLFGNLAVTGIMTPAAGNTPATPFGGGGGGGGIHLSQPLR
jgi:hypothetical protein